jgi:hypothetical protein
VEAAPSDAGEIAPLWKPPRRPERCPGSPVESDSLIGWGPMIVISFACNLLVGYGARSVISEKRLLFIFPLFVAIAPGFIAAIDSPRHGIIRINPQNMIEL